MDYLEQLLAQQQAARDQFNAQSEAESKARRDAIYSVLGDVYQRSLPNYNPKSGEEILSGVVAPEPQKALASEPVEPVQPTPDFNTRPSDAHSFAPYREKYQRVEDKLGMGDYEKYLNLLSQGDFRDRTPAFSQEAGSDTDRKLAQGGDTVKTSTKVKTSTSLGGMRKPKAGQSDDMMTLDVGREGLNQAEGLKHAQETASKARLGNEIIRAADFAGAAIAGVKPTGQDNINKLVADSDRIVTDFQARMEKEKDDPNSPMSKGFRQFMERFGVKVQGDFSASMGEKFAPMAMKAFEAEMTRQHQREMKELTLAQMREARAQRESDKAEREASRKNEKQFTQQQQLLNHGDQVTKDTQAAFDNRATLEMMLEDYLKGGGDFQDMAIKYGFIKSRDNTAVREGEIKLLQSAGSIPDQIRRSLSRALLGKTFDKADVENLRGMIRNERLASARTYDNALSGVRGMAKQWQLPLDPSSRPDILDYLKKNSTPAVNNGPVQIRRKSDGVMKLVPPDMAEHYLASPDFERVQ